MRLHEHRGPHIVPAGQILCDFREQIGMAILLPQVVMGIDDDQIRIEHRLVGLGQPSRIGRRIAIAPRHIESHEATPTPCL